MGKTSIEWARNADDTPGQTWNPVTGCTKVSPGCDHCYAETIAHRFAGGPAYPNGFDITFRNNKLEAPLRYRSGGKTIFVNSLSDLFHREIPDSFIANVFAIMACSAQNTFQLLSKRHDRMRSLLTDPAFQAAVNTAVWRIVDTWTRPLAIAWDEQHPYEIAWPLPNLWLGVSVENQKWADIRIPQLELTPAAVRFASAEPLLGPIDFTPHIGTLDWIIVGGESGAHARPMHPDWARQIRDTLAASDVPFTFKQWGEWNPAGSNTPATDWDRHYVDTTGNLHTVDHRPDGDAIPPSWAPITRRNWPAEPASLDGRRWQDRPHFTTTRPGKQPPAVHARRRGAAQTAAAGLAKSAHGQAAHLRELLRRRHTRTSRATGADRYLRATDLPNLPGTIDLLALDTTSDPNPTIAGFTIATTADAPATRTPAALTARAASWSDHTHEWYVVTDDPSAVTDLPDGWGLLTPTPSGKALSVRKRATRWGDPQPLPTEKLLQLASAITTAAADHVAPARPAGRSTP